MAKRFMDTDKYKDPFIRSLPGAYKLLWDYINLACDHAGVWIVDFEIAQLYLGQDVPVNSGMALALFNKNEIHIIPSSDNSRWFIPSYIEYQYGELDEKNRVHNSVIEILKKYDFLDKITSEIKPLKSPLEGAKDKDKDKDKDNSLIEKIILLPEFISWNLSMPLEFKKIFLSWLQYKRKRGESYKDEKSALICYKKLSRYSNGDSNLALEIIETAMGNNWAGFFKLENTNSSIDRKQNNTGFQSTGYVYKK
jgi:hypothetical protein